VETSSGQELADIKSQDCRDRQWMKVIFSDDNFLPHKETTQTVVLPSAGESR
jgi:hypothetical protein